MILSNDSLFYQMIWQYVHIIYDIEVDPLWQFKVFDIHMQRAFGLV